MENSFHSNLFMICFKMAKKAGFGKQRKSCLRKRRLTEEKFMSQIGNLEVKENPTEKNEMGGDEKKAISKTAKDRGQKKFYFLEEWEVRKCVFKFFDLYIPPIPAS
jgi:hypothetical protein